MKEIKVKHYFCRIPNHIYQSDNQNISWNEFHANKPFEFDYYEEEGSGEDDEDDDFEEEGEKDCVQVTRVQWTGDWLRGAISIDSPWKAIWNPGEMIQQ